MKKTLSIILSLIMLMSVLPIGGIAASAYSYDADKAIAFAQANWNTHSEWQCAEYVARCMVAGGFPTQLSSIAGYGGFAGQVTRYGKKVSSSTTGTEVPVKLSSFNGTLKKGDPICVIYNSGKSSGAGHIVLYSGKTNSAGVVLIYAHNKPKNCQPLYAGYSGSPAVEIFGVNLNGTTSGGSGGSGSSSSIGMSLDKSSVSLGTNSNTSTTVKVTCTGGELDSFNFSGPSCVSVTNAGWNVNVCTLKISAKSAGSGTVKITAKKGSSTVTKSINVSVQGASLSASSSSVSLNLDGTKSRTVNLTAGGNLPSSYKMTATTSNGNVKTSWGSWSGKTCPLTITGGAYGATTITVKLLNSSNNTVLATTTVNATVTSNSYTITFNANGGTGAPAAKTVRYGEIVSLPTTKPTYNDKHTVTFDANGGTLTSGSKTEYNKVFDYWYDSAGNKYYANGSTYSFKANTTLYAHYSYEKLSAKDPTKDNAYFIGWYDSNEQSQDGCQLGNLYVNNTTNIDKDMTLYAIWGYSKEIPFGDINLDGKVSLIDNTLMFQCIYNCASKSVYVNDHITKHYATIDDIMSTTDSRFAKLRERPDVVMFFYDMDLDGYVSAHSGSVSDKDPFNDKETDHFWVFLKSKNISDYGTPEVNKYFRNFTLSKTPKISYNYGEAFDVDSVELQANYTHNSSFHHYISNDIIISGYDPYKIGKQTVTAHFYQWSVNFDVTVNAPDYQLTYDANGGYVSELSKTVSLNEKLGTLATPSMDGYTFLGWYTDKTGGSKVTADTVLTEQNDIRIYAHWQKNSFNVTYNANGGSGAPSNQTNVAYNSNITVPSNIPTKSGYIFKGWSLEENGSDTVHPNDTLNVKENITLYAVYEEISELSEDYVEDKLEYSGQNRVYAFTPSETAGYVFNSFGGVELTPTLKMGNIKVNPESIITDEDGFVLTANLNAGKTYYLTVSGNDTENYYGIDVHQEEETSSYELTRFVASTCSSEGYAEYYCKANNDTQRVTVAKLSHKAVTDKAVAATFKKAGRTVGSHCSVCGAVIKPQKAVAKLKSPKLSKVTKAKKAFTAKWAKINGIDGYQVRYSLKKNMKSSKTVNVKKSATSKKVSKLKAKKTYYVQIRAYKTINGKKVYSSWSAKKTVKTK